MVLSALIRFPSAPLKEAFWLRWWNLPAGTVLHIRSWLLQEVRRHAYTGPVLPSQDQTRRIADASGSPGHRRDHSHTLVVAQCITGNIVFLAYFFDGHGFTLLFHKSIVFWSENIIQPGADSKSRYTGKVEC